MSMKTLDPIIIAGSMAITITRLSRSFAMAISITTMMSMSTVETVFIDISMAIISTISRFSRSLSISITTISIMTMSTMETVLIDIGLTIVSTISRLSIPFTKSVVSVETLYPVVITRSMAIITRCGRPLPIAIVAMKPL